MQKANGKITQDRIMTAIVGSYPKPGYLLRSSGRALLDTVGMMFYDLETEIGTEEFQKRLDKAALMAIEDQNTAGVELITDGEERRGHYVLDILRKLGGFDFDHLQKKPIREGRYVRELPVVAGKIEYIGPIVVKEYEFTQKHANGIAKIGLPGPITVTDSVGDSYYKNEREAMAMGYARAIRHEIKHLIEAGCRAIQFDDPVLLRYPDQAKKCGLKALQACFEGFEEQATFLVHVCRGYPDETLEEQGIEYKANAVYYEEMLKWFSESTIDIVSIEGAQGNLDLSILPAIGEKTVMLGVLDVGSENVESVESLVQRGREALQFISPEQLIFAPDCGMIELSRTSAQQKLMNMTAAVAILNGELQTVKKPPRF
jgi:5-methyltetrahydropteroyltriglutamate--homocysteine methyltransferase